jgi:DNA-binding CsgD family transcriptional regulator
MPAKTSATDRALIHQMYLAGEPTRAIAAKLNLDRNTVTKYRHGEPWQAPAPAAPAAQLSAREVRMLKLLADAVRTLPCQRCDFAVTYLISSHGVVCPNCRQRMA